MEAGWVTQWEQGDHNWHFGSQAGWQGKSTLSDEQSKQANPAVLQTLFPYCISVFPFQESPAIRAASVSLFGQLIMKVKEVDKSILHKDIILNLLPLILHFKDNDFIVAMVSPVEWNYSHAPYPTMSLSFSVPSFAFTERPLPIRRRG